MNNFENEKIRLPEEITQENGELRKKVFGTKTKEELKEERERNKYRAKLPKDDTFVEMGIYAKNMTMPKKVRKKIITKYSEQGITAPEIRTKKISKNDVGHSVNIRNTNYIIREVINESDGFQAIVFENPNTHECTFTIAGSYSLSKPLLNPAEWYKDWVQNNLAIGFKRLPPQLETAIKNLDRCKEKYNITSVTGYSLGAILAGLLVQFKRNKHLKTYLYNGGLPKKLVNALRDKYGDEISPYEPVNMITMLSEGELVTDWLSIVRGAGIFMLKGGEKGHNLEYLENATNEDYKEIDQAGIAIIDGLKDELSNSTIGTGGMYSLEIPLDFSQTVKKERDNQSEKIDADYTEPQSADKPYLEGHVEKNVYEDLNNETDGNPIGYAANLATDDVERELLEQLKNKSIADIGIAEKIQNGSRILEELISNEAQKNSQLPKQSASQTESGKEKLSKWIKKQKTDKVNDTSKYPTEQLIKDTLMYHGALHDFCYPSDIGSFGSSEEIFSEISDINKNRYYTPPITKEKSKPKHGRYLNSAHEEEIERVVSKIFDSVARDLGI